MRCTRTVLLLLPALAACAGNPDRHTLAELHKVEPDMTEVQVENSLDQAMVGYRKFLEEAPTDLKLRDCSADACEHCTLRFDM